MGTGSGQYSYPAVFNPTESGYDVSFPDFPGCVTFGQSLDEAKAMAEEVLSLWIEELTASHQELPPHHQDPVVENVTIDTRRSA
jgi:predicted RNase H-like HicB family nuclease